MNKNLILIAGLVALTSCSSGGNTSGGEESFDEFTSDSTTTGTIELKLGTTRLEIAETDTFKVYAKNANGAGVANTQIVCDTERGLSLIEPTTGTELTDSNGQISGTIGCSAPGSFRIGCRLPVGGNKRTFATVSCTGTVPAGFDGFAGAGGGTLGNGGGVDNGNDGSSGGTDPSNSVRVTGFSLHDDGNASSEVGDLQVDTQQNACITSGDDPTCTAEPYHDSVVKFRIKNESNSTVRFTTYSYTVSGVVSSSSLAFTQTREIAPGQSGEITSFLANAVSGRKRFIGSSTTISDSLLARNVNFTLRGTNDQGESFSINTSQAISFSDYDLCPSGTTNVSSC